MLLYPNAHNAKLLILNRIKTWPNYQMHIDHICEGLEAASKQLAVEKETTETLGVLEALTRDFKDHGRADDHDLKQKLLDIRAELAERGKDRIIAACEANTDPIPFDGTADAEAALWEDGTPL
jgi:hypothetical protein